MEDGEKNAFYKKSKRERQTKLKVYLKKTKLINRNSTSEHHVIGGKQKPPDKIYGPVLKNCGEKQLCFVCGSNDGSKTICVEPSQTTSNEPYFSFLKCYEPPNNARKVGSMNYVSVCFLCFMLLNEQWSAYERKQKPLNERIYYLKRIDGKSFVGADIISQGEYMVQVLGLNVDNINLNLYNKTKSLKKMKICKNEIAGKADRSSFSNLQEEKCQNIDTEKFCKNNSNNRNQKEQLISIGKQIRTQFKFNINEIPKNSQKEIHVDMEILDLSMPKVNITCEVCYVCDIKTNKGREGMRYIYRNSPYFSIFSKYISQQSHAQPMYSNEIIRSCQSCHDTLIRHWRQNESQDSNVNYLSNEYNSNSEHFNQVVPYTSSTLKTTENEINMRLSVTRVRNEKCLNSNTYIPRLNQNGSLNNYKNNSKCKKVLTCDNCIKNLTYPWETIDVDHVPLKNRKILLDAYHNTLKCKTEDVISNANACAYCFLCGLNSELLTKVLYANKEGSRPYFPLLLKYDFSSSVNKLCNGYYAIVCTFCYHSLLNQWKKFEEQIPYVSPDERLYNWHDYICNLCGITTYRKRVRALPISKFPFVKNRKNDKGLLLENDKYAVVCLDCYESLRQQSTHHDRVGVPISMRGYNWVPLPPPPEDSPESAIARLPCGERSTF